MYNFIAGVSIEQDLYNKKNKKIVLNKKPHGPVIFAGSSLSQGSIGDESTFRQQARGKIVLILAPQLSPFNYILNLQENSWHQGKSSWPSSYMRLLQIN